MKFVVGLGNPDKQYVHTRHNVGWWVLDELAARSPRGTEREQWRGLTVRVGELTLLKPWTWMNDSGEAVLEMIGKTAALRQDILIVLDDLALPLGTLRLRTTGSAGGHRGLQSIVDRLGAEDIPRLRLGIGPCPTGVDARDFVLSEFDDADLAGVDRMVCRAADAVLCWAAEGADVAMTRYNGPGDEPCNAAPDASRNDVP